VPLKKLLQDAGLLESLENENKSLRLTLITELDELIAAEQGLGPQHREVAARAVRVGKVHAELGNLMEAENFLKRALSIGAQDRKANIDLIASASKQLGVIYVKTARTLQAEPLFMDALDLLQASQKAESPDALEILQELAILHDHEKNYEMSWNLAMSAIALACQINSVRDLALDFLDAFNHCALEVGRQDNVEATYMQFIRALRKSTSCNSKSLSMLNMKLGDFYRDNGQRSKARSQYEIAIKLLSLSAIPDNRNMQILEAGMAKMKS
jgi:tetratricopeptide (TPR) repeat protein